MSDRVYLDWNATAPLRPEARKAMLAAMDAVGNPSSVHAEGREARAILERARAQVAALVGAEPHQVVFTSGATEANAIALAGASSVIHAATEHASVLAPAARAARKTALPCARDGCIDWGRARPGMAAEDGGRARLAVARANSETGVLEDVEDAFARMRGSGVRGHCDLTQAAGREILSFRRFRAATAAFSSHKIGGPTGVGALVHDDSTPPTPLAGRGGGQEGGWRPGTENIVGAAGFGAAAEAALREAEFAAWEPVGRLRNILEERISERSPQTIFIGAEGERLPNTSCFATPGWSAELQVMQLDLAGFAVSAGSACSSGKVGASHVLSAMGYDEGSTGAAIRVSLGPGVTEDEILRFCDAWSRLYEKRRSKAA